MAHARMLGLGLGLGLAVAVLGPRAMAENAGPVAIWGMQNGTLPPPYHWTLRAAIAGEGRVTMRFCRGYSDADTDCGAAEGMAPEGAVQAILAAAKAADLLTRPVAEDPRPPVGGATVWGSVRMNGQELALPPFPAKPDAARVQAVMAAIAAAIPPGLGAAAQAAAPPGE